MLKKNRIEVGRAQGEKYLENRGINIIVIVNNGGVWSTRNQCVYFLLPHTEVKSYVVPLKSEKEPK